MNDRSGEEKKRRRRRRKKKNDGGERKGKLTLVLPVSKDVRPDAVPIQHPPEEYVIRRRTEEVEVAPGLQVDVRATAVKEVPPPIVRVAVAVGVTVLPFPPPPVRSRGERRPIASYPADVGFAMHAMGLVEYPDRGPHLPHGL